MKICLLAPANSPHTQKIAYTLKQRGYKINIFTFHNARLPGIDVKYFPPLISALGKINYMLNSQLIKKFLRIIKPDILHAHYVSSYGVSGFLTHFHPFVISVWGSDIYDAPRNVLLKHLIKKALSNSDRVLSTSKTMAEQTEKFVKNKDIIVTPFGVDLTKFYQRKKKKSKKFIIGTARGLVPKYGIRCLLKAFAIFSKENPLSELHIAGEGPQKKELIRLSQNLGVSNKVKFYGYINPDNIPEFLSMLDVFCMPSVEEESFGVAALEAQACGIPVVASRIGGLHETILDGKTGFLVPPKDSKSIAEKFIFLYKNNETLITMANNCVNFVKQKYDWSKNFEVITKVYDDLTKL